MWPFCRKRDHTQKQNASPPKCSWEVKSEDLRHTPRGYEKRVIIYTVKLSGQRRADFPSRSINGLRELKEETGLGFFHDYWMGRRGFCGLHLLPKEGAPTLCYQLPLWEAERTEESGGFKALNRRTSNTESDSTVEGFGTQLFIAC